MREPMLLIFSLTLSICARSQPISVAGNVTGVATKDFIEFNTLLEGEYYPENSTFCPFAENGSFKQVFDGPDPKFVLIKYGVIQQWILLAPSRPLYVHINPSSRVTPQISFSGDAGPENDLIDRLNLHRSPFFIKGLFPADGTNPYVKWSVDSVVSVLIPIIRDSLDSYYRIIKAARLPTKIKDALITELTYSFGIQFEKFKSALVQHLTKYGHGPNDVRTYNNQLSDEELDLFTLPTEHQLQVNPSARAWLRYYVQNKYDKIFYAYSQDTDKANADKFYQKSVGIPYSALKTLSNRYGGGYEFIVVRHYLLPAYASPYWIANNIYLACDKAKDITLATNLRQYLGAEYPNSSCLTTCDQKISSIKLSKDNAAIGTAVHIRRDSTSISTIKDLVSPYVGKVIFLDIWGSWCGPCMEEMRYAPALIDHFKNKNVVFLYLDYDEDKDEGRWKDFIYLSKLSGEHIRMNKEQIAVIWNAIGPTTSQGYPHYCIFDKNGNLVVKDAMRPSSGDNLYDQILSVVSQ